MKDLFNEGRNPHIAAANAGEAALTKMALVENNTEYYHEYVDQIPRHVRFFVRYRDESEIADTITIIKIKIDSLPAYADQYKYEIAKYEKYFGR